MNYPAYSSARRATRVASILLALVLAACGGGNPETMLVSAREYLAKNDPKAAAIQLKNVLQNNPELPEARYLLGVALSRAGDPVGAETELRKAQSLKYSPQQVAPALAQALLAQGQFKKLTEEFAATELTDATAKANLQTSLANAYGADGNLGRAKVALAAALKADPDYAPALIIQARDKASVREFDAALLVLDGVLAKTPADYEASKLKGDILLSGKDQRPQAMLAYRKAVESKPDYLPAHAAIVSMLMQEGKLDDASKQIEQMKKAAPNSPQARYFETQLAFQKKDMKLAKELSQQLMKIAPDSVQVLQLAGAIELQAGSLVQAEAYLSKGLQTAPDQDILRRLLVSTYLSSGQPEKALTTLQPALKRDGVDAATNALAGEVYLRMGDSSKAQEYFTKASKQDPKNTRAKTVLALAHLAGGRADAGFGELQDIATSDAGIGANMALISAHLQRKEYDKALAAIDSLEKKQPDKPLAANLRGRTLLAKKDSQGARKSFERSIEIDPLYFPSVASLASMDMADKKPEDARKRFDAVLAKDPKNLQALLALAELRSQTRGSRADVIEIVNRAIVAQPAESKPRVILVELLLRGKEFKQAVLAAQNGLAVMPENPELLDALGRAQQGAGDMNQALIAYGKVAALQPQSPLPQMRLAEAYIAAKDKNAAASSLRKAIDIKPDFLEAQTALFAVVMGDKNYSEASNIARNIQKQRPKESVGYELEGDIAGKQKNWDAAANAYRAGLKQAPLSVLAVKLNATLGIAGKVAELEKFSMGWLKDNPNDTAFRVYLADSATGRKQYGFAEKMYLEVLKVQPDNTVALNNLAWVSGRLNKDGVAYAEKAVALSPNQPAYMDTLATLLSEKNNYAKAVEWQTKALAVQPQNGVLRLNLARIHIKGGQKELARKELDQLAKLGDKFDGQAEVARLVKSL